MGGDTAAVSPRDRLQLSSRHEDDTHVRPSTSKKPLTDLQVGASWASSAASTINISAIHARREDRNAPFAKSRIARSAAMLSAAKAGQAVRSGAANKQSSVRPAEALSRTTLSIEMRDSHDCFDAIAADVNAGFNASIPPILVDDCTGGVYFLRSRHQRLLAVFKPADEEAYAPNNPKRFAPGHRTSPVKPGAGIREGIPAGHASIREFAAYLLDNQSFAGVPATAIASASHPSFQNPSKNVEPKRGALQVYVPHSGTADDVSVSLFDISNVQAVAILDIRLANQDRHGGNLLVIKKSTTTDCHRLVPIDHGACLPRVLALSETSFVWLFWPQARKPFDARTTEYIASLDAFADEERLRSALGSHDLDEEVLLTLHFCTALLQTCALDWKLTAHEIGLLMIRQTTSRHQQQKTSVLETLIAKTLEMCPVDEVQADRDAKTRKTKITVMMSSFRSSLSNHLQASGKGLASTK